MALTLVKKRSGSIAPFAPDRIQNAIFKAYEANHATISDLELDLLVSQVAKELEYRYSNYGTIKASQNLSPSGIETGANYWDGWGGVQTPMSGSSSLIHNTNLTSHAIRAVLSYDF